MSGRGCGLERQGVGLGGVDPGPLALLFPLAWTASRSLDLIITLLYSSTIHRRDGTRRQQHDQVAVIEGSEASPTAVGESADGERGSQETEKGESGGGGRELVVRFFFWLMERVLLPFRGRRRCLAVFEEGTALLRLAGDLYLPALHC